jgi:hypothetical protein
VPEKTIALEPFQEFHQWLADGSSYGYGIGEREPWTDFTVRGFNCLGTMGDVISYLKRL